MKLKRFVLGMIQENCYVVSCSQTKKGFIVDPGIYSPQVMEYIQENNIDIEFIILTHAHGDHIGGLKETAEKLNIPIYIHKDEDTILKNAGKNYSTAIFGKEIEMDSDRLLKDGEVIELGEMNLKIIHTPGHTPGGICIYVGNSLLSGDTLFAESVGRTDFPYCSTDALIRSIREKLFILPDDTTVYPGHGLETTIGHEKKRNPFVRE